MAQKTVFISHSSKDNDFTRQLTRSLEAAGLDVWVDLDDLTSGERWLASIQAGLEKSSAIVIVMSRAARQSEWVEREALLALQLRKPIFIAYIEDTPLPLHLIDRQYTDFQSAYDEAFQRLLPPLQKVLADVRRPQPDEKLPLPDDISPDPTEDNFFKYLAQMDDGEPLALIARELYAWAQLHTDNISFGGRHTPCFHMRIELGDKLVTVASVLAYIANPAVQIPFDHLKKYPPYTSEVARINILHDLNDTLPAADQFADERASRRPTISLLPALNQADILEGFKHILQDMVDSLRKADE